jgi:hypothetical protein
MIVILTLVLLFGALYAVAWSYMLYEECAVKAEVENAKARWLKNGKNTPAWRPRLRTHSLGEGFNERSGSKSMVLPERSWLHETRSGDGVFDEN